MSSWLSVRFSPGQALPAHCEPTTPLLAFLSSALHTCIPTPLALVSTLLGYLSIASWLFAQLPQIVKNYSLQSTSGLSIYFLVEWCLGDSANLLGALLTRQAAWQVVVAAYYVCVDVVLVGQYFWYTNLKPQMKGRQDGRRARLHHRRSGGSARPDTARGDEIIEGLPVDGHGSNMHSPTSSQKIGKADSHDNSSQASSASTSPPPSLRKEKTNSIPIDNGSPTSRRIDRSLSPSPSSRGLLMISLLGRLASAYPTSAVSSTMASDSPSRIEMIGSLLSWSSTLLYLASRLPQIYKNHIRQSTSGLSAKLFIAAFFGNLFYSSSILTDPCAWNDLPAYGGHGWVGPEGSDRLDWTARAAPFWLGAAGVLGLDATVGMQFLMFGETRDMELVRGERGSWQRVTGWMRGWVPRSRSVSPTASLDRESQPLLLDENASYGTS